MSLSASLRLLSLHKNIVNQFKYAVQSNNYAKDVFSGKIKKKLKMGQVLEKKVLPVETDPHKLINFVCGSNILKEGKDVEVKPDSEYPDWLWEIRTGPAPTLEELDPNTRAYWKKVRKAGLRRHNLLSKLKPF